MRWWVMLVVIVVVMGEWGGVVRVVVEAAVLEVAMVAVMMRTV